MATGCAALFRATRFSPVIIATAAAAMFVCVPTGCAGPPAPSGGKSAPGAADVPRGGAAGDGGGSAAAGGSPAPAAAGARRPAPAVVEAPADVAALIPDLRCADRARVERAKEGLTAIGGRAVPALVDLMKCGSRTDIARATMVLVCIGPESIPPLATMLSEENTGHVAAASVALAQFGGEAVPALTAVLKSGNENARYMAADTLGDIGPEAVGAAAALREAAGDPSPAVREAAAKALKKILFPASDADGAGLMRIERRRPPAPPDVTSPTPSPDDSPERIAALLSDLRSHDQATWLGACKGLKEIGAPAVPDLLQMLRSGEAREKAAASAALVSIGRPAVRALAEVVRAGGDPLTRFTAIVALGAMGRDAADALPVLAEAVRTAEPPLRPSIEKALRDIRVSLAEAEGKVP